MDIRSHDAIADAESGGAADGHVFADGGDEVRELFGHVAAFARMGFALERFDVTLHFEGDLGGAVNEVLEQNVARDEIGFGVDFNDGAGIADGRDTHEAFSGDAAGFLGGLRQTLLTQPVDGRFHIAARFVQRVLAVHHARAGLFAQVLYELGSNCGHVILGDFMSARAS